MSLGFLLPASDAGNGAVAWRGPMASSSLSRLTADTEWGDLDVLIVDMPPGTGDVHITYVSDAMSRQTAYTMRRTPRTHTQYVYQAMD